MEWFKGRNPIQKMNRCLKNKKRTKFIKLLKNFINPDPTILEVGAYNGKDSLMFLKNFQNVKLYCFEPDPRNIKLHKLRVKDKRCHLIQSAISNINGYSFLFQSNGKRKSTNPVHTASSSLKEPKNHLEKYPWCKFDEKFLVRTYTLDKWTVQNNIDWIDFLWADVQGAEAELIEGGLNTFKKIKLFYTEYSNEELYKNQITLKEIENMIPDFKKIFSFGDNALFINTNLA